MSPSKRIRRLIARRAQLEDAAAREQLRLLKTLRRDILARLADAGGFQLFRLQQMLAVVDAEIGRYGPEAQRLIVAATRNAWGIGSDLASVGLPEVGVGSIDALYGLSPQLLQAIIDVTSDQVRAVWSELGTGLKAQIRRVTLGVVDPFEAIGRVARLIRDPKTFGTAFARAETIVRTETNRTFAMASYERMKQGDERLARTGERLMKWWLSAEDSRVRPAHVDAARDYPKPSPIPVDQPFIVGGERLMYPLDPNGSAANTIQCRCVPMAVVVSAEEFELLRKAA